MGKQILVERESGILIQAYMKKCLTSCEDVSKNIRVKLDEVLVTSYYYELSSKYIFQVILPNKMRFYE